MLKNIKGGNSISPVDDIGGGGGCLPGFFACHCDGEFQGCYTTVQFCILICKNT